MMLFSIMHIAYLFLKFNFLLTLLQRNRPWTPSSVPFCKHFSFPLLNLGNFNTKIKSFNSKNKSNFNYNIKSWIISLALVLNFHLFDKAFI